jgi:hypothetical protein
MSTLKTNNVQVGQSVTATNNFTLYQPSSPDGTVRLGNGNSGSVTDVASFTSAGVFAFNSGYGSVAPAYGCRAWVNFNGTGTVAIRASGNVSSITDNGVGNYTLNFTTAMPNANYAALLTGGQGTANGVDDSCRAFRPTTSGFSAASYQFAVVNQTESAFVDANIVEVAIFR